MFDTNTEAEGDISGLHRFMPSETPFLKADVAIANRIPQPGNTLWKPKICGASLPTPLSALLMSKIRRNPRFVGQVFRRIQRRLAGVLQVVIPDLWGKSSDLVNSPLGRETVAS